MNFLDIKVKKKTIKKCKIVYISRKKSSRRKVRNEKEVIKIIKLFSGEVFYFEDYKWIDQINMVKNCEVLICPHGASMTNILFVKTKTKIIELRHEKSNDQNMYFSMASQLKIRVCCNSNQSVDPACHAGPDPASRNVPH